MRRAAGVAFVLYLGVVCFGVFGPSPDEELERAGRGLRKLEQEVRSVAPGGPGEERPSSASGGRREPARSILGDLGAEDLGNIAMFVPLGALFPLLWPRWWRLTIPAGVSLSGLIELVQLGFLSWRTPSLTDIGWNSLGTVVGFGLYLFGAWLLSRIGGNGGPGPVGVGAAWCAPGVSSGGSDVGTDST